MRRRPQRLQVTTFPFLAVLLCAMGSLILFLLVMDRRAKIVARAKALEAAQLAAAEKDKKIEENKDEWERQRQTGHELLARQQAELVGQLGQIQAQAATAQRDLQAEANRLRAFELGLAKAKHAVAAERAAIAARQA